MTWYLGRMSCVYCQAPAEDRTPWSGCGACSSSGRHANVLPSYDLPTSPVLFPDSNRANQPGIFKYRDLLPITDDVKPVSLGEGSTALVSCDSVAERIGVSNLWIKDESRNPTWSYKDRLAAVAVTVAKHRGAEVVVLSSTGNHGAAAAAYAAAAGLRCVVLTSESVPTSMKTLMQSYGAAVVAFRDPPERWRMLAECVTAWGWTPISGYPNPPIGSNPFGVDGYKTIAYEIVEDLGFAPSVVIVPTAYGDGLTGIHRGFLDLREMGVTSRVPRLVSVDPFGAYEGNLASPGTNREPVETRPTPAFSIGTAFATTQALMAIAASSGAARTIANDDRIMEWQLRIARTTGLYLEAAAAITFPALLDMVADGSIVAEDCVVSIATSSGLKDIQATGAYLRPVVTASPTLSDVERALNEMRA